MTDYRLSKAAWDDLKRIYAYGFNTWGEALADRYYNALLDRFEAIATQPFLYPQVDFIRTGYRRSVHGSDSIYYRVEDNVVEIMAILGSQDIEPAFD